MGGTYNGTKKTRSEEEKKMSLLQAASSTERLFKGIRAFASTAHGFTEQPTLNAENWTRYQ